MFDFLMQLVNYIGQNYGLLPAYAIIISMAGFMATSVKHLFFMLSIMAGVYITMFKAFNLKTQMFPFDASPYLPVHYLPFKLELTQDHLNTIAAVLFVYGIGLTIYIFKSLIVSKPA